MVFEKHGVYSLKVIGQVLIVDATGPFNDELVVCYNNALEACIQQLESSCWGQIVTLHEQSLFTPDAERTLNSSLKRRKERGLRASAVVCKSPYSLVQSQIDRIYSSADVIHDFCKGEEEALLWLYSCQEKKSA